MQRGLRSFGPVREGMIESSQKDGKSRKRKEKSMADNAERIKEKYRDGAEDKRASQSRYGALEFE